MAMQVLALCVPYSNNGTSCNIFVSYCTYKSISSTVMSSHFGCEPGFEVIV